MNQREAYRCPCRSTGFRRETPLVENLWIAAFVGLPLLRFRKNTVERHVQ